MPDDDDDKTPARTPSAMHRLNLAGLALCPKCDGDRFVLGERCTLCEGKGNTTLEKHNTYLFDEAKRAK